MERHEIYKQIRELEKEIETVKMLQGLGKVPFGDAKAKIKDLDAKVMEFVNRLPDYDKKLYMIKREFGHMDEIL